MKINYLTVAVIGAAVITLLLLVLVVVAASKDPTSEPTRSPEGNCMKGNPTGVFRDTSTDKDTIIYELVCQ